MSEIGTTVALIKALQPKIDPTVIKEGVEDWLDDHPEATTTVEDGAITKAKLDSNLQGTVDDVDDLKSAFDSVIEEHVSKNLYDKSSCNPMNGYTYNKNGVLVEQSLYATTGKIPVEAETQYVFKAGTALVHIVRYFSGTDGGTYISGDTISGASFTTPANCTFIALNLFAEAHTTDQYNAAMDVAQLEKGSTATPYEPYGSTYTVPLDVVENGETLEGLCEVTVQRSLINLYDKTLAEDGKGYSNGVPSAMAQYAISGKVPVEPNTQYCISKDPDAPMELPSAVYEYDSTGAYTGKIIDAMGSYVYGYLLSFVTSSTTHYISFNMLLNPHTTEDFNDTIDTLMVCYGTMRPQNYTGYNKEPAILANRISDTYFHPDCFSGKLWMAIGTSITWYDSKVYEVGLTQGEICRGYVGNVARRKKLIVKNYGISGSTLAGSASTSLINRYQNINWGNANIVTIEYGVNDLGNNIPVGTAQDAAGTSTFAACYKTIIEYILAQNPKICLVICTEPDVRGTNINNNGNTLKDFTDVTLAIAAQYRLPVCDWYYHSGISALNKGDQSKTWMTVDGTHPSDAGHLRMGAMLNQVFDSLIC